MVRRWGYGSGTLATLLVLALVTLPACTLSPEQAAVRALLEGRRTMQIRPATIQVLQTGSWGEEVNVLVTFQAAEESGQISQCLFLYEAHEARAAGWVVSGGGGGCGPVGGSGEPIDIGAGQHSGTGRPAISHVKGLVHETGIRAIEVIWDDGELQRVEVINSSYLAVRGGLHEYTQIQALDEGGEVVYTYENPPPAPGKDSFRHPNRSPATQFGNLPIIQSFGLSLRTKPSSHPIFQSLQERNLI
jgi:hypothetical protein